MDQVAMGTPENGGAQDEPTQDDARKSQAGAWVSRVLEAKGTDKIKAGMKRMRQDMKMAFGKQWPDQQDLEDPRYVANIVLRHLLQRRAALYARNPVAVARRRRTLDFKIWDGDPQALATAQQTLMMAQQQQAEMAAQGIQPPPQQMSALAEQVAQASQLLQDYQQGMQRRQMVDRMAETLEILWEHQLDEQDPAFKTSMKSLVLRALTCGVGFLKLGFHRLHEYKPEDAERVTDVSEQIAALESRLTDAEAGTLREDEERLAELRDLQKQVTNEAETFVKEGLDIDFPRSTAIIVDPACRQLKGFIGARWIAHEFYLTDDQIHESYGIRVADMQGAVRYDSQGKRLTPHQSFQDNGDDSPDQGERYLVFEIYDKHTRQVMTVCEGYDSFLKEPAPPAVKLERFWPVFTLTFNDVECEDELYPPSDVRLMSPMQTERNLTRQRLREHRDAARPGHVTSKGRMDEEDKARLQCRGAHDVVELNNLADTDDISRIFQTVPVNPIDPNLYETASLQEDIYQTVGTQEAVLGGASGATATETSIAESSRLSTLGEAVDELDDFLSAMAKAGSHLMLSEFTPQFVEQVVGRGAIWPDVTAPEIAKDLWLEVRAGSSGRPNKAMEIQNMERVAPFLMQLPGLKPERLAKEFLDRLDDRLPIEEFLSPGAPSITALNAAQQPSTGDPATDPTQQGVEGGDKNSVEQGDSNMGPRPPAENRNMDPNMQ